MVASQSQRLKVTTWGGLKVKLPNSKGVVAGSPVLGQSVSSLTEVSLYPN